jgi:predicted RNA-binding Zn-ribbon protein involved in translation (DUF1610 family)
MKKSQHLRTCPRCGDQAGIPIFYGMPARPPDYVIDVDDDHGEPTGDIGYLFGNRQINVYCTERGEAASGGCVVQSERWRCKQCGFAW